MTYQLHHGDCLNIMPLIERESVDAIVTDPPYGLADGDSVQGISQRVYNALIKIGFPDLYKRNAKLEQGLGFARVSSNSSDLSGEYGTIREEAGIGVPESAVDLQDGFTVNQKISDGDKSTGDGTTDGVLSDKTNTKPSQFLGDFILKLGDVNTFGVTGDVSDSCLAEAFFGGFAVPICACLAPSLPSSDAGSVSIVFGDHDIGLVDNTPGQAQTAPCIVTLSRAVNTLMLRFDLRGRPIELLPTYRADHLRTVGTFGGAELVRAFPAASGLASIGQPYRVRFIVPTADGALSLYWFHLWCPINSVVDSIIPQGGFMGKDWDATLPNPQVWREAYRIAKPGAYLLAFGGTRTFHRLAVDIENAGWEIRDDIALLSSMDDKQRAFFAGLNPDQQQAFLDTFAGSQTLLWVTGQGFPKSADVSKHLDKKEYKRREDAIRSALAMKGYHDVVWSTDHE